MSISCEIPSEDKTFCIHNVYKKLICDKCELEKIVVKFDELIEHLQDGIEKCFERIEKISKRVDELQNTKAESSVSANCYMEICERLNKIEKWKKELLVNYGNIKDIHSVIQRLENLENLHNKIYERIERLELEVNCDKNKSNWQIEIEEKIKELNRLINSIKESYNNLCAPSLRKEPHKCPVCNGTTKRLLELPGGNFFNDPCKSCNGKGIVWG